MGLREPIVRSRPCPEPMLPRNARATMKTAIQHGWKAEARIAAGWPDDEPDTEPMRSIVLRLSNDRYTIYATWAGSVDGTTMGFDGAWRRGHGMADDGWRRLGYNEVGHLVKGTTAVPTAKAEAELQLEANQHLAAITALRPIAWPTAVIRQGISDRTCKGKVVASGPGVPFLPCANFTSAADEPLCREGCTTGVLADGTSAPKKTSKSKTTTDSGDMT